MTSVQFDLETHRHPTPMNLRSILFLSLPLISFTLNAQQHEPTVVDDPYAEDDGSWIGISGSVESTGAGDFVLNYGDGTITVELADDTTKAHKFIENERVMVFGIVDEKLFRSTTIQARAVFVESLSTYVHVADGAGERLKSITPTIVSGTVVQGRVTGITAKNLTLDQGDRMITVDLTRMEHNPLEATGRDRIAQGDLVTALGDIDQTFWKGHVLRASSIEVVREPEY